MRLGWLIPLLVSGTAFAQEPVQTPPTTTLLLTKNCKAIAKQKAPAGTELRDVERIDVRDYDEVTISLLSRPNDTVVILSGKRAGKAVPDRVIDVGGGRVEPDGYIKPQKLDRKGTFIDATFPEGGPANITYRLRMNRCSLEVLRGGRGDDGLDELESLTLAIQLPPNKPIRAR